MCTFNDINNVSIQCLKVTSCSNVVEDQDKFIWQNYELDCFTCTVVVIYNFSIF